MYYCTAQALNAGVTLGQMLVAGPLIIASTVGLPTLGGEGARELSAIALLVSLVGEGKAFLTAHLGFWIGLFLSLIGGVLYLLRPADYRPQIVRMDADEGDAPPPERLAAGLSPRTQEEGVGG
jgi:hypothetical protein